MTVERRRFPSWPALKKYSAACSNVGISVRMQRRSLSETLSISDLTREKGSVEELVIVVAGLGREANVLLCCCAFVLQLSREGG